MLWCGAFLISGTCSPAGPSSALLLFLLCLSGFSPFGVWDYLLLEHWHHYMAWKWLTLISINSPFSFSAEMRGLEWPDLLAQRASIFYNNVDFQKRKCWCSFFFFFFWSKIPASPIVYPKGLSEDNMPNVPRRHFTLSRHQLVWFHQLRTRATCLHSEQVNTHTRRNVMHPFALPLKVRSRLTPSLSEL